MTDKNVGNLRRVYVPVRIDSIHWSIAVIVPLYREINLNELKKEKKNGKSRIISGFLVFHTSDKPVHKVFSWSLW